MFRRQTDEVFSTLQQVQRRLSQHTESGADGVINPSVRRVTQAGEKKGSSTAGKAPARPVSRAPRAQPGSQYGTKFRVNSSSTDQPQHVVPVVDRSRMGNTGASLSHAGHDQDAELDTVAMPAIGRPRGLLIRPPMALLLGVLFVASVVGAYALGGAGGSAATVGGVGPAPDGAGQRSVEEIAAQQRLIEQQRTTQATVDPVAVNRRGSQQGAQPLGDHVLVLESYARYSASGEQRFVEIAERYNAMAREFADRGYQPWFGVRRPSSGGLQLVFGALDGNVFGIPDDDALAKKMFDEMRSSRFPTAFWVKIH